VTTFVLLVIASIVFIIEIIYGRLCRRKNDVEQLEEAQDEQSKKLSITVNDFAVKLTFQNNHDLKGYLRTTEQSHIDACAVYHANIYSSE